MIAIGFNELHMADRHVARDIVEIKGEKHTSDPFKQLAKLYNLPLDEVVMNIRKFTNKQYKTDFLFGNTKLYGDIKFDPLSE